MAGLKDWSVPAALLLIGGLTGCGGGGGGTTAPAPGPAPAPAPSCSGVLGLNGAPPPAMVANAFKGPHRTDSNGRMEPEAQASVQHLLSDNQRCTGATHTVGFSIDSNADPLSGRPFQRPLVSMQSRRNAGNLLQQPGDRLFAVSTQLSGQGLINSRWVVDHDLVARSITQSSFVLWSYIGEAQGDGERPSYWGAYSYGVASPPSAVQARSAARDFVGVGGGHWVYPDWDRLNAYYGALNARHDPVRGVLQLRLQLTERRNLQRNSFSGLVTEINEYVSPEAAVAAAPLECEAPVSAGSAEFSCELAGGRINGRFYGGEALEIAGTFQRYESKAGGGSWGVAGGFAARAQ